MEASQRLTEATWTPGPTSEKPGMASEKREPAYGKPEKAFEEPQVGALKSRAF